MGHVHNKPRKSTALMANPPQKGTIKQTAGSRYAPSSHHNTGCPESTGTPAFFLWFCLVCSFPFLLLLARGGRPLGSGRQLPPQLTVGRRPLGGGGGHLWARWLHNPCRLGDPHRLRAGARIRKGPTSGQGGYITPLGAFGARWLLGLIPMTTNCRPEAPWGGGGLVGVLGPAESPPPWLLVACDATLGRMAGRLRNASSRIPHCMA